MDQASGDVSPYEAERAFDDIKSRQRAVHDSLPPKLQAAFGIAMGFIKPPPDR
jgi:hypothetical protein